MASNVEKNLDEEEIFEIASADDFDGWYGRYTYLFNFCKSIQRRIPPLGFGTTTIGCTQSVASVTGAMTPACTSWSSSVFTILLKVKGISRGTGKANGTASSLKKIFMGLLFISRNVVSSKNTSLYDFIDLFSILLISASVGFSDIMNLVFSAFNMLANFRNVFDRFIG